MEIENLTLQLGELWEAARGEKRRVPSTKSRCVTRKEILLNERTTGTLRKKIRFKLTEEFGLKSSEKRKEV